MSGSEGSNESGVIRGGGVGIADRRGSRYPKKKGNLLSAPPARG